MPIHVPGLRARRGQKGASQRNVVAVLQLTAMVDMFTVMVVFLLQNYATTNQILPLPEAVNLPAATSVKELKPSTVIVVSDKGITLNEKKVAEFNDVKAQEDWMIASLSDAIQKTIQEGEQKKASMGQKLRDAVNKAKPGEPVKVEVDEFRKITVQADRKVDFLTVKKVMFTATEAGIQEINFAVLKDKDTPGT